MTYKIKKVFTIFSKFLVFMIVFGSFAGSSGLVLSARADTEIPAPTASYTFDGTLGNANAVTRVAPYDDSAIIATDDSKIEYVEGKQGQAAYLNGQVGLNLNLDMVSEMYSFGFWIKPDVIENFIPTIIITPTTFIADEFVSVTLSTGWISPVVWTHIMNPYDVRYETGIPGGISVNQWAYLTVCVDGDNDFDDEHVMVTFYINGYNVGSGPIPKELLVEGSTTWFGVNIWDPLYTGVVDELTFYDKCLSEEQVKALYLSEGGDPDASNPNDNAGGWFPDWNNNNNDRPGKDDPAINVPDVDNNGKSTILDEWLDSNSYIQFSVTNLKPDISTTSVNVFSTERGNSINIYYLMGAMLFIIFFVIIFTIYKKMKQKY